MKLTLTSIKRYSEDKEGKKLVTSDGRPYTRLIIRTKEYGEKPLSGFDSIQTQNLKEGDEIEAEVKQSGDYLNFKLPNKQDLIGKALEEIRNAQLKHGLLLQQIAQAVLPKPKETIPYPEGEPPESYFASKDESTPF